MAGRTDEVEASVNTHVAFLNSFGLLFLTHVHFMLVVDEFGDGKPEEMSNDHLGLSTSTDQESRLLT